MVRLQPLQAKLLAHFIKHPNQVMSNQQLFEDVWGTQHKSESSLARTVSEVRKHLLEIDISNVSIENIPSRGYRLVSSNQLATNGNDAKAPLRSYKKYILGLSLIVLILTSLWIAINSVQNNSSTINNTKIVHLELEEIRHSFTEAEQLKTIALLQQDVLEQLKVRSNTSISWKGELINPTAGRVYQSKLILKW